MNPTIQEMRTAKVQLENSITKLLKEFTLTYKVEIDCISLQTSNVISGDPQIIVGTSIGVSL